MTVRRFARMVEAAALRAAPRPSGAGGATLRSLTRASDGAGLWLVTAAGLAATGRRGRRAAAAGVAALGLSSAAVNGPVKLLVRRPRPGRWSTLGLRRAGRAPRTSSFPSGHTASAFAFATAAGLEAPALGAPLLATAALVGWSRVHGAQHFPSDVAGGAAVGTAVGLATWAACRRWERRSGAGAPPAVARAAGTPGDGAAPAGGPAA